MENPKRHPLWKYFIAHEREHNPDALKYGDDWLEDWTTFQAGASAAELVRAERERKEASRK